MNTNTNPTTEKKITTTHAEIGYSNNVEIIETALREQFGFSDASITLRAVADHIWSCGCWIGNERHEKQWGTREITEAIKAIRARLEKMEMELNR